MYRLSPKMEQNLRKYLSIYHDLFVGERCSSSQLEELLAKSIRDDNNEEHHARWKEGGHDSDADITVSVKGKTHYLQIKSGKIKKKKDMGYCLELSGYRMGKHTKKDKKSKELRPVPEIMDAVSEFLDSRDAEIVSVPHRKVDDEQGRRHIYRICYIKPEMLKGVKGSDWFEKGAHYRVISSNGVLFTLHPSMSWQVWWTIPLELVKVGREFTNGELLPPDEFESA